MKRELNYLRRWVGICWIKKQMKKKNSTNFLCFVLHGIYLAVYHENHDAKICFVIIKMKSLQNCWAECISWDCDSIWWHYRYLFPTKNQNKYFMSMLFFVTALCLSLSFSVVRFLVCQFSDHIWSLRSYAIFTRVDN